jgi:hypothetical protein
MNIQAAARYLQLGYRIKRENWDNGFYIDTSITAFLGETSLDDLLADDWEIDFFNLTSDQPITYSR